MHNVVQEWDIIYQQKSNFKTKIQPPIANSYHISWMQFSLESCQEVMWEICLVEKSFHLNC